MSSDNIPGGDGEEPIGEAKRNVQAVKDQWNAVNEDLTTNWAGFDASEKIDALHAQALFAHKVARYFLTKEFGGNGG